MAPSRTNLEIVRTCLDALSRHDLDTALPLLAPDVEWRNAGMPTLRGKRVFGAMKDMVRRGVDFGIEWHHVAETADGVVLTDRHDTLGWKKVRSRFWVCGTFHVVDGQITEWDDKFSGGNLAVGLVRGVLGRG